MNNSINSTSDGVPFAYVREPAIVVSIRITCEVFIAFIGIVENIFVCAVILSFVRMRTGNNYYILNASLADLGLLLITFPFFLTKEQAPSKWPFGELVCRVVLPMSDIFQGVSFWSITAVAVNRFRGICFNDLLLLPYKRKQELRKTKWVCLGIWLLSFITIVIPIYVVTQYIEEDNLQICLPLWKQWPRLFKTIYHTSRPILTYALPLVTIIFCYVRIALRISRSSDFQRKFNPSLNIPSLINNQKEKLRHNSKIIDTFFPLVFIFAVTVLPLNALRVVEVINGPLVSDRHFWILMSISRITLILHAAINPVLYCLSNKRFREALWTMLTGTKTKLGSLCAGSTALSYIKTRFCSRSTQPQTITTNIAECWDTHL